MGYYTNYELSIHTGDTDLDSVKQRLDEIMEMTGFESCFEIEDDLIRSGDSLKWYDHDEECAELSKSFPGVVLKLHGEGEDTGDLWDAYYANGMCLICRAKIVYPEFDPNKLVSVQAAQQLDTGRL